MVLVLVPLTELQTQVRSSEDQTPDDQTESKEDNEAKAGEMYGEEDENICQEAAVAGGGTERAPGRTGRSLGHLAVDPRPALVALTGELLLHVHDVVVVEVTIDVEASTLQRRVVADAKKMWVKVQVGAGVEALPNAPAVLLAERFAAQFGGRGDVDDIMSQLTVNELLHRHTVFLKKRRFHTSDQSLNTQPELQLAVANLG